MDVYKVPAMQEIFKLRVLSFQKMSNAIIWFKTSVLSTCEKSDKLVIVLI